MSDQTSDVGWWRRERENTGGTGFTAYVDVRKARRSDGLATRGFVPLGDGDDPTPSRWMVEALARVGSRNRRGEGEGSVLCARAPQYQDDLRAVARLVVAGQFGPGGASVTDLVMRETYDILRSLGYA